MSRSPRPIRIWPSRNCISTPPSRKPTPPSPRAGRGHVILLNKTAEAEPLHQQVEAFGDGNAYAQYFFYQRVAPSVKSILSNTDGVFADLFKQFVAPHRLRRRNEEVKQNRSEQGSEMKHEIETNESRNSNVFDRLA